MAKEDKKKGSFWPSYVDIMTTLFAVMLILFAVSYSRFKSQEGKLKGLLKEYEEIVTVYSTVAKIDSTDCVDYDSIYLKHLVTIDVEYQEGKFSMYELKPDLNDVRKATEIRDSVERAGRLIVSTIVTMEKERKFSNNMKFLIVVEGQSSKLKYDKGPWQNNYTLSYLRAQNLVKFWKDKGIHLDSIPKCEILISGSGEEGVPRYIPGKDVSGEEWKSIEHKNQRFLINIVPVIGNIDSALKQFKELGDDKDDN